MGLPGTWMTESGTMVYRVVPKCACSTIGQLLYYSDHGEYFDGDIHDARTGLHKWAMEESQPLISRNVLAHKSLAFTCVRNPYARILSAYFDKVCGIQRNGKRYRGRLMARFAEKYGIDVGGEDGTAPFDQIKSFRRFLLFARDTIRWRRPISPDIHWSPVSSHLGTFVCNGGRFDRIIWTERFAEGMQEVIANVDAPHPVDPAAAPRFNESAVNGPRRAHPIEDYFDDLSMYLVQEVYRKDFDLFGYDMDDPANAAPRRDIDLDEVHAKLLA
jgi:hypothetical protein